jgi:hypothetical protein
MNVTFIDRSGNESPKVLEEGAKVSTLVGSNLQGVLLSGSDGVARSVTRDVELRDGDTVELVAVSGKNG